jgi:thioredoxin-dependent peroxiredoxin
MSKLTVGTPAPGFYSLDQDGKPIQLEDFKGKKIALYFYPKDDTPGCTAQACNLRDNYQMLQAKGYEILGVSPDSVKSHKKFETKYELPFRLVADEDHSISEAYDVWGQKKMMGREYMGVIRTTFLIDEKGFIEKVIDKPDTKEHTKDILGEEATA